MCRARQLMNILDKFKEADIKNWQSKCALSSGSESKLAVRKMGYQVTFGHVEV